ncbi:MAG: DNA polymerase III subunit beta [Patescibacteria group bacterium]
MQIECRQEHLARALQIVGRMVGTRGTLPVLGNILLATDKGRLKVAATDLELGVQTWIGGKVEDEGSLTVPARLLIDFVVTNSDPIITLTVKDTTLHLQSEHHTASIKGIEASEFPLIPAIKQTDGLIIKAQDLKEAVTQTIFATAIDETRPVLTGVLLRIEEETARLVATDSYRLAERILKLPGKHTPLQVIVPARTFQEVARIITDPAAEISIFVTENQVLFVVGETELISRLIDGIFPDYEQIIPKEVQTTISLERGSFAQVMKMASFFARESANNVQLKASPGETAVAVTAISPQIGEDISRLSAIITGEAVEIAFNAKFILDALAIFPTEEINLELAGKLTPGVLRMPKDSNYLYLIMPLRVDN